MSEQAQVQTVTRDLGVGGEVVSGLQQHLRPENVDWGLVVAIFSVTVQPLMGRGSWRHGLHCESMEVILPGQVREVRWADGSRRCDFPCAGGLLYHGGSWADSFWGTKWVGEQGRNRWAHIGLIVWSICWVLQLGGRKLHRRKREGPRSPHSSCPPAHHAAAGRQQDNIFTWLGTDCQMLLHGLKFSGRFGLKWSSIPFTIYICYGCFFFPLCCQVVTFHVFPWEITHPNYSTTCQRSKGLAVKCFDILCTYIHASYFILNGPFQACERPNSEADTITENTP